MDRFKAIIRDAIGSQAARLTLTVGESPLLYTSQDNEIKLDQHGPNEYGWLATTHQFLFNMAPEPHAPVPKEGSLNIPNLGKLLVLVLTNPNFSISLYFPGAKGNELFESDKNPQKSIDLDALSQTEAEVQNDPFAVSAPPTSPYENHENDSIAFTSQPEMDSNPPTIDDPPEQPMQTPAKAPNSYEEDIFSLAQSSDNIGEDLPPPPQAEASQSPNLGEITGAPNVASEEELYSLGGLHSDVAQSPTQPAADGSPNPLGVGPGVDFESSGAAPDLFGTVVANNSPEPEPSQPSQPSQPFSLTEPQPDLDSTQVATANPMDAQNTVDPFAAPPAENSVPPVPPKVSASPVQNTPPTRVPTPSHQSQAEETPTLEIEYGKPRDGSLASISGQRYPIDDLLSDMVSKGSSDLHLSIGQPIIFRIDGDVRRTKNPPLTPKEMKELLDPIIPSSNRTEFLNGNDTDFAYSVAGVGRFRVNIFRNNKGVGSVMRHIPSEILTAEKLGLPSPLLKFATLHKGLVLVTGPTGSGKSTTLAAIIDRINKSRKDHILTIEDPIEFVHENQNCLVNQREIGIHTTSFARALRAALREDPDIVLIGEMRDLETVHIAIETAETGHLVFGTLHTTTAISTIDRIIDQFPAEQQEQIRTMLASSLQGVVAQTLLKKKGGGRVASHEILIPDNAVRSMIRKGDNHMIKSHMQTQKAAGNILLNENLLTLVKDGKVDLQEAFAKTADKKEFMEMAPRFGINPKDLTY